MRSRSKLGIAAALLVASAAFAGYRRMGARTEEPLPVLVQIDGFSLVDQRGKPATLGDLAGNVWIADFIFTGCQAACPMLTSRMRTLQRHLEERERAVGHALPVRLISFSVDPEVDTPDKLAAYAAKWGADERRWSFLTGSLADVNRAVVRGMKIPFEKSESDATSNTAAFDVMHGEHLVVVDGRGRIRGYFVADPEGMQALENAVETLLIETGDQGS